MPLLGCNDATQLVLTFGENWALLLELLLVYGTIPYYDYMFVLMWILWGTFVLKISEYISTYVFMYK